MDDRELKKLFDDLRRHFDVTREHATSEVQALSEAMATNFEEVRGDIKRLDLKLEKTALETQAMIKFSHRELDRRITTLEENHKAMEKAFSTLQTQVKRLSKPKASRH